MKSITVEVRLFASLRAYLPEEEDICILRIDSGATVRDVLDRLNIPVEYPKIILLNAVHGSIDSTLEDNNILSIFPPIAGG